MWIVFYLIGLVLAYIIILDFVNWNENVKFEFGSAVKCLLLSLFSWLLVIAYVALMINAYIENEKIKKRYSKKLEK
jgi:hypothetical protein